VLVVLDRDLRELAAAALKDLDWQPATPAQRALRAIVRGDVAGAASEGAVAVELLAALIVDELAGVKADCVGGLEMGAVPLIAPVAMRSFEAGRPLLGFFVRKAPKDHGTRQRIEGLDLAGKTAVILEDVSTTGGSAMQAVEEVRAAGGTVALVLSILDRGEGSAELYAAAGVPFKSLFRAEEFLRD
jgi:orotate phosphoribosyltransferase